MQPVRRKSSADTAFVGMIALRRRYRSRQGGRAARLRFKAAILVFSIGLNPFPDDFVPIVTRRTRSPRRRALYFR